MKKFINKQVADASLPKEIREKKREVQSKIDELKRVYDARKPTIKQVARIAFIHNQHQEESKKAHISYELFKLDLMLENITQEIAVLNEIPSPDSGDNTAEAVWWD